MEYDQPLLTERKRHKRECFNTVILTLPAICVSVCSIALTVFMSLCYKNIGDIMKNISIHVDIK